MRAWVLLLFVSALAVTGVEMALLYVGTGYLSDGFNIVALEGGGEVAAFTLLSLALDVAVLLAISAVLQPLISLARLSRMQVSWLCLVVAIGVPTGLAALRYNVYAVAGRLFDMAVLQQAAAYGDAAIVAELFERVPMGALAAGVMLAVGVATATVWIGHLEARHPWAAAALGPPPARKALLASLLILGPFVAAYYAPQRPFARFEYGIRHKTSGLALLYVVSVATDFDLDGFGALARLPDPAPLDPTRYPYAQEVAGNQIDENGLAGDLPIDFRAPPPVQAELPTSGVRPHLLLIYLESFRQDLLGREVEGRPVTPFLNALAREGGSTPHAWAHTAWTRGSRLQLFGGRVAPASVDSSIIDDFKALGYRVGYFSGQDESYGDSEEQLGVPDADHFYDARQDLARRASRTAATVSLQVSWKVLLESVEGYLDDIDPNRPQFLYVNIVDTHFPYTYDEMDEILAAPRIKRGDIRADRAADVVAAYENTAANVDRAAARLVEKFRAAIGGADHGILVLADHGEAFYEHGILGHGQTLDPAEVRIPFIVWGIGGEWPEPLGASDVRGLLRRNLSLERGDRAPRPHFVADPARRVLQFAPDIARPRLIGLRGIDDLVVYDFPRAKITAGARDNANLEGLAWRWEAEQALELESR